MSTPPDRKLTKALAAVPLFNRCTPKGLKIIAATGKHLTLLTEEVRNATVRAMTDVEPFAISRLAFKTTLLANPTVTYNILRTVAARQLPG